MADDPTTNPAPQAPRQEKLPLTWDGQQAAAPAAPATGGTPPPVPPRPEPAKPEPHFPVLPKTSPFRTPAAAAAPEPRRTDASLSPTAAVPPAIAPHLVNRLRTVARALRDARESRQYSVAQVSQKTKIPREFIENIENQAAASLPKPVYTKSYIRQLCREYGLDAAPLLEEYRLATEGGTTAPDGTVKSEPNRKENATTGLRNGPVPRPRPTNPEEKNAMSDKKFSPSMVAVIIVVLGIIALALLISGLSKGKSGKPAGNAPANTAPQVDMTQPAYVTPRELPARELPVPNSTTPPAAPTAPAAPAF